MTKQAQQRRWYDQDPLLSLAMGTLKQSSDKEQVQLALHVMKIINEHNFEESMDSAADFDKTKSARWYDLDNTLKTSIERIRCCSPDCQNFVAQEIVEMLKSCD
jgi:hypothetical protein